MPKVSNIFRKTVFYIHDFFCRKIDDGAEPKARFRNPGYSRKQNCIQYAHIWNDHVWKGYKMPHTPHLWQHMNNSVDVAPIPGNRLGRILYSLISFFFYSRGKKYLPGSEQFYYQREKEAVTKKKDEKSAKLPEKIRELVNNSGKYHCQKWTRLDLYLKKSPATPAL